MEYIRDIMIFIDGILWWTNAGLPTDIKIIIHEQSKTSSKSSENQ